MKFHFALRPISEIAPWGSGQGTPSLHWFGLTDGWFWMEVGDQELFRYSQEIVDYWTQNCPDAPALQSPYKHYEDYQVARYWEDLLDRLPAILDPIPADLAARVADAQGWSAWLTAAAAWQDDRDDDASQNTYTTATLWWSNRVWWAGHLQKPPKINLWRTDETVHIRWDNREIVREDRLVWQAQAGEATLPVSEFRNAVTAFHTLFLNEMTERVHEAAADWPRPDVAIDLGGLLREQTDRAGWLEPALSAFAAEARREFSWDEVSAAITAIEQP